MSLRSQSFRNPLLTVGVLAALTGIMSTGCSSFESEAAVNQPIAVDNSGTSVTTKDERSPASLSSRSSEIATSKPAVAAVPVVYATQVGEETYAVEDQSYAMTAAEAGEDAYAVEDHSGAATGRLSAYEKRQRALAAPTDAELTGSNGAVLPRIIPGMTIGMPYAQARLLILNDGWRPADGLEPGSNNNGLDQYPEVEQCSGTGMGLCVMSFVDAEMNRFNVITGGSGPDVMDWTDVF